jgi:acyl-CoA synthetase (AMP-forming)/AMP-acid ligase II
MAGSPDCNFAGQLTKRLGGHSFLINAVTGEEILPGDLHPLISSFGAGLLRAGLKTGDRVLIGCTLSPLSSIAYLGSMYAGLVAVPIEENILVSSLAGLLKKTGARAVWTEKESSLERAGGASVPAFHGPPAEVRTDAMPPAACQGSDLAVLAATSGSTGTPRFVMVSHGNLTANTEAIVRSQNLLADERAMLILPLSYCFGASVFHSHLYQGGGVVFDSRFMFPDKVLHAINSYRCTTFAGVPTVYNILLRRSNLRSIPMPGLRRFLQAGGPLAPQRVAEMRDTVPTAKFYVMYGQTEATARITCLDPAHLDAKLGSAGLPLDNLTARIVDEEGRDLPTGQTGEIMVSGPSITLGYLDEPEESGRVFQDGWLRTGDLGHLDADGYLWIDGRKSNFLKIRGVRVSIAEVEARVASLPGVSECAVAAVAHPEAGEALALYIVPDKDACEVVETVHRSLPPYWTYESINIVSQIPKTASGKVARGALLKKAVGIDG